MKNIFIDTSQITIVTQNKMNHSENGICLVKGKQYFYKKVNIMDGCSEIRGYYLTKNNYPSQILRGISYDSKVSKILLIYSLDTLIQPQQGLLTDIWISEDFKEFLHKFLDVYSKAANNYIVSLPEDFLVSARVSNFKDWYGNKCIPNVFQYGVKYDLKKIFHDVIVFIQNRYLYNYHKEICIIGHGDINEVNVSSAGLFFDFSFSGLNSIYYELVVGIESILFNHYYDLKYHKNSYINHDGTINKCHTTIAVEYFPKSKYGNSLLMQNHTIYIPAVRYKWALAFWGIFEEYGLNWNCFKLMFIFRILTIRDIFQYDYEDFVSVLWLCAIINTFNSFSEFWASIESWSVS